MDSEKGKTELHEEGNQNNPEDEKTPESVRIITPHVTNPSPEIVLISTIRSVHDHDHMIIGDRERRERVVTRLVTIANSTIGGFICDHLLEYGGTTLRELEKVIPTTKATASRTLSSFINFNVVEILGYVGIPYISHKKGGPRVPIYTLKGADPQVSIEAQKRYGDLVKRKSKDELEIETHREEARDNQIQDLVGQVFDDLPRPLTMQSTPIYDAMNRVGIPDDVRKDVKAGVLRRIQKAEV